MENNIRTALISELRQTFDHLVQTINKFDEDSLNRVPFAGSWTAGQVGEHLVIATAGIPDSKTTNTDRSFDEQVPATKAMFFDLNQKFEAMDILQPKQTKHDKATLIAQIRTNEALCEEAASKDLEALCLDMELPVFGFLTRFEWVKFVIYHTQRHIMQIEKIYGVVSTQG